MKTTNVLILCLGIFFSANCLAKDLNKGQIVGNFDEKVKLMTGDNAIINLGGSNGIIKGDVLNIYKPGDSKYYNTIGKCSIVNVYDSSSICEIIKIYNNEIGRDVVISDKLSISDPNLFPAIFQLLAKVVEPYEPHKEITVYVHSIFDEQNNITKFSEKVQKEIKKVFFQKKRIKAATNVSQSLFAYLPGEYEESRQVIEDYLKKDNIDILIAGTYKINGDKIELSLYKVDKNWEDIAIDTTLNAATYSNLASSATVMYKPARKEQNLVCDILYKPIYYKTNSRDERNRIIDFESKNDPFVEYNMNRISYFNIISPIDFKLIVDNNEMSFEKTNAHQFSMNTGRHEITAIFKKGFYFNDSLIYQSDIEVKKDIVLILDNPGDITIEVTANPVPGKENIDFRIYKKADTSRPNFKQVLMQKNNVKTMETFKD